MKNNFFHIIIFTVVLFYSENLLAQENDSLVVINTKYDSLLKSSENEMEVLFYPGSYGYEWQDHIYFEYYALGC